jgi:uncharacterized RDD family membrane protein YckC
MKCPKCDYLGFETGERCKNCGYDFSLLRVGDSGVPHPNHTLPRPALGAKARGAGRAVRPAVRPTPLLSRDAGLPDEPLVKLPPTPRPPLAVRRTPDTPRSRVSTKAAVRTAAPRLEFPEAGSAVPEASVTGDDSRSSVLGDAPLVSNARRVTAALLDYAILLSIDVVVIYLTLRIAALAMHEWRALPPVPLLAFLGLVKLAYFATFTAAGGQTIGKMATRIRVVRTDEGRIGPSRALRRALAGGVSLVTLGVGFLPALIGADRRALHDRLAGTRVVALPSA